MLFFAFFAYSFLAIKYHFCHRYSNAAIVYIFKKFRTRGTFSLLIITIYKSLFITFFFVRDRGRSKTIFFKPTTPLDGQKCSLRTSNFWAKSFLPFDLYHEKSCKNGEISTRPQLIILLKTRSNFFWKSHNPWRAFAHLPKLKCLMHCGRTFQAVGNITQDRCLL